MNIIETLFAVLPLPVGNITVTVLLLALVYMVATLILEAGIRLVKFTLAADDKNAPDYKIDNILINLMKKLPLNSMRIIKDSLGFYVKGLISYLDTDSNYLGGVLKIPIIIFFVTKMQNVGWKFTKVRIL